MPRHVFGENPDIATSEDLVHNVSVENEQVLELRTNPGRSVGGVSWVVIGLEGKVNLSRHHQTWTDYLWSFWPLG